jgi:hypothetical protein
VQVFVWCKLHNTMGECILLTFTSYLSQHFSLLRQFWLRWVFHLWKSWPYSNFQMVVMH